MPLNIINIEQLFDQALGLQGLGRYQEAQQAYLTVLQMNPNHINSLQNMGVLTRQIGRNDLAIQYLNRAIALAPDRAELHCNLGDALATTLDGAAAMKAYQQSLRLNPNSPITCNNTAVLCNALGEITHAIQYWERALALVESLDPAAKFFTDVAGAKDAAQGRQNQALKAAIDHNLASAHLRRLEPEKARDCYLNACALNDQLSNSRSGALFALLHIPNIPPAQILAEHRQWWNLHAGGVSPLPARHAREPSRKLRVGFVSAEFRDHAVTYFLLPLLENLDRNQFEPVAYSAVAHPDHFTQVLKQQMPLWRDVRPLLDEDLARQIQSDEVDILFDLAGHSSSGRLRVFAFQPAPIQISYLGYPATSGSPCIQYRIADPLVDPPGLTDGHYSERLVRLPTTLWCFRPAVDIPADEAPPSLRDPALRFTFGSFNNSTKMSPQVLALWSKVLQAIPDSRMMIKAIALIDEGTRDAVRRGFAAHGISPERILLLKSLDLAADHYAAYRQIDLALDTFHYHGTTTTCEALWMNTPVISLAGQTHISRVGVSLLTNAGLPQLIAQSESQFVNIAATLAKNPDQLLAIRRGLRQKFQASPVMNGPRFAQEFAAALRTLWKDCCQTT